MRSWGRSAVRARLSAAAKAEMGRLLSGRKTVLAAEDIVASARRKASPLHALIYDCNDQTAIVRYRLERARAVIAAYEVEVEYENGTSGTVSMEGALSFGEGYRRTEDLSSDPKFAERMVQAEWQRVESLLKRMSKVCRVCGGEYADLRKWCERTLKSGARAME